MLWAPTEEFAIREGGRDCVRLPVPPCAMGSAAESTRSVEGLSIGDSGDGSIGNNSSLLALVLSLVVPEATDSLDSRFSSSTGGRIVTVPARSSSEGGGVGSWVGSSRWSYSTGIDMAMWR